MFLRNLLLDEKNELHNRAMHISGKFDLCSKADIGNKKADIRKRLKTISTDVSEKTIRHVIVLYEKYGREQIFGRACVEEITGLKSTRASEFLKIFLENQVIESVKGHGKGKYHFL